MGLEPLDAYRKFLEAQLQDGTFMLSYRYYEGDLWRINTNNHLHDFDPDGQRSVLTNHATTGN